MGSGRKKQEEITDVSGLASSVGEWGVLCSFSMGCSAQLFSPNGIGKFVFNREE